MSITYKVGDRVEIVELVDKKTRYPLMTFFILNRKFHTIYQHRANKPDIDFHFVAEYVPVVNIYVAGGYEMATRQHGRPVPLSKIPDKLRINILNALPMEIESCSDSTPFNATSPMMKHSEISLTDGTSVLVPPDKVYESTDKNLKNGEQSTS